MTKPLTIVITGASSGVGYFTALELANQGHNVYALARRGEELSKLKDQATAGSIVPVVIDLENFSFNDLDRVFKDLPVIDRLINNAGKLLNKSFLDITEAEIESVFKLNFTSVVRLIQYFHPKLKKSQSAHIVNISSVGGVTGSVKFPGLSIYSSSKGALSILSECLSQDFKEDNISVNCLALGSVNTDMLKEAFPDFESPTDPETMSRYISNFTLSSHFLLNGLTTVVSLSNP